MGYKRRNYRDVLQKNESSILRTIELYEGKLALCQSWEESGAQPDHDYIRALKEKIQRAKIRLAHKGVLNHVDHETLLRPAKAWKAHQRD